LLTRFVTIVGPALLDSAWKIAYTNLETAVPQTLKKSARVLKMINLPVGLMLLLIWFYMFSRSSPIVPRKPSTLSSKILYLCRSSKLLHDVHKAAVVPGPLEENLTAQDTSYRFGWFQFDEDRHEFQLGVEREPILQPYSYGHNILKVQVEV
jgi:hypothetical protein